MNFSVITIIYVCCCFPFVYSQPMFCAQTRFDAVFNFGPFLTARKDDWIWILDVDKWQMSEPRKQKQFSADDSFSIKTAFFISPIPWCDDYTSNERCVNFKKAEYLVPTFFYSIYERQEIPSTFRVHSNGTELKANIPGYPWHMDTNDGKIWPEDWYKDSNKKNGRASVYWPNRFQVMFITGNGIKESSAISYSSIMKDNWWKSMEKQRIDSDVHFVGMFNLYANLYAFGDNRNLGNNDTKLYDILVSTDNRFTIQESLISLHQFFGCKIVAQTTKDSRVTYDVTDDQIIPEDHNTYQNDHKPSVIGIAVAVVAVILVFIIALVGLIVFIVIRKKKKAANNPNEINNSNTEFEWKANDVSSADDTVNPNRT